MRILIDNSGYHLQNMGDVAMLQVAVARLRETFPAAQLLTLTINAPALEQLVGGLPLHANRRRQWQSSRAIPVPVRRSWLSPGMQSRLDASEDRFKVRFPHVASRSIRLLGGRDPVASCQTSQFVDDVESCDLVVATGGGFFTDAFLDHANDVLTTLELAQQLKKPTLVFGQGIGPLTCHQTRRRMGRILGRVPCIGIREEMFGRQILLDAGVSPDQIVCAGDDAIELSHSLRTESLGDSLGINFRVADYAGIGKFQLATLRETLANFCRHRSMPSLPIPISFFGDERDVDRVNQVMEGTPGYASTEIEQTPDAVAKAVRQCRVVVTGSYHAGVFALSQGIPVVGLAGSAYYQSKFLGLQAQFGMGCLVVDLSKDFQRPLHDALNTSCENASAWREPLLDAARRQIHASRSLYQTAMAQSIRSKTAYQA